jgi:uncharacterized protein
VTLSLGLLLICILALSCLAATISKVQQTALAQPYIQTIKHRNLVIDLGNGVNTNAQLTIPAIGKGPFPAVLLVHGSGRTDMNESLLNAKPFWQISQYLTERGFVVLRYDKRGIGANHIISDSNVWGNTTFNELKQDAEKALAVLINQPEVDPNKITVLGHSEGTMIAPRVAIDNTTKVKNVVLIGAVAQNLGDIQYLQVVSIPLHYAEKVLDHNHDGMLSVAEANENPVFSSMVGNFTLLLETTNGTKHQLNPKYNTNKDAYISINNELKPKLVAQVASLPPITLGKKCTGTCPIWVRSHYALEPTLSIIGNVSPKTSILILQGENDTQTLVQQAFLLQQALIDKRHPDHTLITYPNLGHLFFPSSEWKTSFGPIQEYVLADLYAWLEAHSGLSHSYVTTTSTIGANTSSLNTNTTSPGSSKK